MKSRLIAMLAGLASLVAFSGLTAVPAQAAPTITNVAIGDSVAAGWGADAGYPLLVFGGSVIPIVLPSGGTTTTLRQALALQPKSDKVTKVTLTVGANDIGWVEAATALAAGSFDAKVIAKKIAAVPLKLAALLKDIIAKYPKAKIVVTGYPLLFQPTVTKKTATCAGVPFVDAKLLVAADAAIAALDAAIAATTVTVDLLSKSKLVYADVIPAFQGKGLCQFPASAINYPLDLTTGAISPYALHPNTAGQALYAAVVAKKL